MLIFIFLFVPFLSFAKNEGARESQRPAISLPFQTADEIQQQVHSYINTFKINIDTIIRSSQTSVGNILKRGGSTEERGRLIDSELDSQQGQLDNQKHALLENFRTRIEASPLLQNNSRVVILQTVFKATLEVQFSRYNKIMRQYVWGYIYPDE